MLTLIQNGEVFAPEPLGRTNVLLAEGNILKVGGINPTAVELLGVDFDLINAEGCVVTPGFIDPHQHLLGGSGEEGFSTQTPEIAAAEIISAGVTTVVGCLGVDTTMKTLPGLLAKIKGMKEEGLNAYMWSGGYNVPPTTITGSIGNDILFIDEVIGAGEVAISDERSAAPTPQELARVAHDVYTSGILSKKAGLIHFHVGGAPSRLHILRELIDKFNVNAEWLYPSHVNRSGELLKEAIDLAKRGSFVDLDTVDEDLTKQLDIYLDGGGPEDKLTLSSDASKTSPQNLFQQLRACIIERRHPIERILPLVTSNTARALKLAQKGAIAEGKVADVLVINKETFELRHVISAGRRLMVDGSVAFKEAFLKDSNRKITLEGEKELKTPTVTKQAPPATAAR